MTDLEGQELSEHNAIQNAIQALCVKQRNCWKEDPGTCPSALNTSARDMCTLYQEPPEKPKEKPETIYLKCPRNEKNQPLSWCMAKCYRNTNCQKFKDYVRSQAK